MMLSTSARLQSSRLGIVVEYSGASIVLEDLNIFIRLFKICSIYSVID